MRDWEARFAPLLAGQLRAKRRGQAGKSWYVDETYVKVHGQWHYLYRAIDREGNLVDPMLSATRDLAAAKAFFQQAVAHMNVVSSNGSLNATNVGTGNIEFWPSNYGTGPGGVYGSHFTFLLRESRGNNYIVPNGI